MSDWSKPFKVAYRVMRVNRNTGLETGRLDWVISGGSIERNQDTNICESGSLTVEGATDLGTDRLRIWADCTCAVGHVPSQHPQAQRERQGIFQPTGFVRAAARSR